MTRSNLLEVSHLKMKDRRGLVEDWFNQLIDTPALQSPKGVGEERPEKDKKFNIK
jgi:hypothetical protein